MPVEITIGDGLQSPRGMESSDDRKNSDDCMFEHFPSSPRQLPPRLLGAPPYSDEMDQILSPSGGTGSFDGGGAYSSDDDSIIQRVEQEIAAARRAARNVRTEVKSPGSASNQSIPAEWMKHPALRSTNMSTDEDDMNDILNTTMVDEEEAEKTVTSWGSRLLLPQVDGELNDPQQIASVDSSFDHVLHLIDNEFLEEGKEEPPPSPKRSETPRKPGRLVASLKESLFMDMKRAEDTGHTRSKSNSHPIPTSPRSNARSVEETNGGIKSPFSAENPLEFMGTRPSDEYTEEDVFADLGASKDLASDLGPQHPHDEMAHDENETASFKQFKAGLEQDRAAAQEQGLMGPIHNVDGFLQDARGEECDSFAGEEKETPNGASSYPETQFTFNRGFAETVPRDSRETPTASSLTYSAQRDVDAQGADHRGVASTTPRHAKGARGAEETKSQISDVEINSGVLPLEADTIDPLQFKSQDTTSERTISNSSLPNEKSYRPEKPSSAVSIQEPVPRETESAETQNLPTKSPSAVSARSLLMSKKLFRRARSNETARVVEEQPEEIQQENQTQPRKIRFRKPYPVLKHPPGPRDDEAIIRDHTLGVPNIQVRWMKPKPELKQLIVAAMGTSLQRRSNACGALKVLTGKTKNQLALVRTDSFLTALLFTASQKIPETDRDLALDARARAVACLRNVCIHKDNRVYVFTHPGLLESLLRVVQDDVGEARTVASGALALLAKSPECREGLVQVEELVTTMARVVAGVTTPIQDTATTAHENDDKDLTARTAGESDSVSDASNYTSADEEYHTVTSSHSKASTNRKNESDREPSPVDLKDINVESRDSIRCRQEDMLGEYQKQARLNACAFLIHLSRHCAISFTLATNKTLVDSCLAVAGEVETPLHTKCIEILRNLTLFPGNNCLLTRHEGVVQTFITAANSTLPENRLSALRALQNLSADASSKAILAKQAVLDLIISCALRRNDDEQEAAVATLYNITTEPSAVVAITNTKNVIATLVHLAHSPDSTQTIRLLACEALATTSLWLQTLAGTGKVPEDVQNVLLPSQRTYGWDRWD